MRPVSLSVLTVCGIDELPAQQTRKVTHVLSLLDPGWPELDAFRSFDAHHRTTLHFHDIIGPMTGRIMPTHGHVEEILHFGSELQASSARRKDAHLLVHCHMGVSRSTAAMLSLLAQANQSESEDLLFARLREIRPQAWPNSLMVGYADELLRRKGRMTAALRRHYGQQLKRDPSLHDSMTRLGRSRELAMAES
ncbi:MAG: tyrosine phosphatase family protein [Kiloniellales bacterium]